MNIEINACTGAVDSSHKLDCQLDGGLMQKTDIMECFANSAAVAPYTIAVQDKDRALIYSSLDIRTNQYANYFKEIGVGTGSVVILHMERSLEFICCFIALLKLEATYVPLDPRYSKNRIESISRLVNPKLIISDEVLQDFTCKVKSVSHIKKSIYQKPKSFTLKKYNPEATAYILFTSGSTGEPKGVEIARKSIQRLGQIEILNELNTFDKVAFSSSVSFDTSVAEIWMAFMNQATLVIFNNNETYQPDLFKQAMEKYNITVAWITSSSFNNLYKFVPSTFSSLKYLLIGGEALNKSIVMNLYSSQHAPKNIINAYGPTEATVFSLMHRVNQEDLTTDRASIPIGSPIMGTSCYILNDGELANDGEIGELCLTGVCLAKGYFKLPMITEENFIKYIFDDKEATLYHTGDMVRKLPNGELEYIGRSDDQVKIRGYRIELAEVEACMQEFPNIANAVVLAHENSSIGKYMVGYYSVKSGRFIKIRELKEFIKKRLPEYMLPSFFISVDSMPVNFSGKVDKKVLAKKHLLKRSSLNSQASNGEGKEQVLPREKYECTVAGFFKSLLEVDDVYACDDFFDLGGHSLLALQLWNEINQHYNAEFSLNDILALRTVEKIAEFIKSKTIASKNNLIKLKSGDPEENVFFFHPIGGTAFGYIPLVQSLESKCSVYAFQDPSVNNKNVKYNSLKQLASDYLSEIKTIQPHGPYRLVGASFGASVMIEIVRQLESQNEQVDLAAMIDGYACFVPQDKKNLTGNSINSNLQKFLPKKTKVTAPFYGVMLDRMKMLIEYNIPKIDTEVVLFKATDLIPHFQEISATYNGWDSFLEQPIVLHTVPGNHDSMLQEPNVQTLAKVLSSYLVSSKQ